MTKFLKRFGLLVTLATVLAQGQAGAQTPAENAAKDPSSAPVPHEGDFVIHNFRFQSGETLPEVRMHYTTFGVPVKDNRGHTTNAVLILHGTSGTGPVSYTHLRAHETRHDLVCRLLLE